MSEEKEYMIPQNIWDTDCRYCRFRATEENYIYGSRGRYNNPCRINIYSGENRLWNEKTKEFDITEHEVYKEHCPACRPTEGFGICYTCRWFNSFCNDKGELYCTNPDGPLNRRNTLPWVNAGYGKEITSWNFTYFTCDRYKVKGERGLLSWSWKDTLLNLALRGKIPKNFNPETWEPLEYMEVEQIEEWKKRQEDFEYNKPENVKKRALLETIKKKTKRSERESED